MDNDFFQKLKNLEMKNEIISIFTDRNNADTWSSGFIESLSKEHIILKHISPIGRYDGFIARRLDNIFRLDYDGIYEHRLLKLYNMQVQSHKSIFTNNECIEENLFNKLLQFARISNYVITLSIDENDEQEDIIGYVKEIYDNTIEISKINYQGLYDGKSTFCINDIVLINCDTDNEMVYKLLSTD